MNKIEKAFTELLQTKELKDISVSSICELTGLNRSTFYSNYSDIYALADKIKENLENEVFKLYEVQGGADFGSINYLKLFRHIKDNRLLYKTYFKLGYDSNYGGYEIFRKDVLSAGDFFGSSFVKYHVEFFRSGLNAIVKMWLDGGCKELPEEMVRILEDEYSLRISTGADKKADLP